MHKPYSRRGVLAGLVAPLAACATSEAEAPIPPRLFVYDDVRRYNAAVEAIRAGADPTTAMQSYLDGASEGMRTWLSVYPIEVGQLVRQLERRPKYYASLATMPERIAPLEPEIARAYARLEQMTPGASIGGVYFLVGRFNAGATPRAHTMIAIEFFGRTPATDMSEFGENPVLYDSNELVQVAVHEGVHSLQRHLQGEANFISIYVNQERMTLRNFAIREGVADYAADLVCGRRVNARHAFAEPLEAEIWAEFQPVMNGTIFAQPGWFQGGFADGRQWPNQMGYFVGYKMAEHMHRHAAEGDAVMLELLSPHTDEQFAAIAGRYAQRFT